MAASIVVPSKPRPRADNQDRALFGQTPWQTVGPFFHYGLPWKGGADLVGDSDIGARLDLFPEEHDVLNLASPRGPVTGRIVEIVGTVRDGEGAAVTDAMIEIWGANAAGRYHGAADTRSGILLDPGFIGFGRAAVDADGAYRFRTVRPGRVPMQAKTDAPLQSPHLAVGIFGRGLLKRLATRVYFPDGEGLGDDPILALVPAARRRTLIAERIAGETPTYRFDIVLRGTSETVFFDI